MEFRVLCSILMTGRESNEFVRDGDASTLINSLFETIQVVPQVNQASYCDFGVWRSSEMLNI